MSRNESGRSTVTRAPASDVLTPRQLGALHVAMTSALPPTVKELAARLGVTTTAAFNHLSALGRKGVLEFEVSPGGRRLSRAYRVAYRFVPTDRLRMLT